MINLRVHTEFHFDFNARAYGRLSAVIARLKALGHTHAAITDATTFGHVRWVAECKTAGLVPILGAEVRVPINEGIARVTLLARNDVGLKELYGLTSLATSEAMTVEALLRSSNNVIKLTGTLHGLTAAQNKRWRAAYADISPSTPPDLRAAKLAGPLPVIAVSDNGYPALADRAVFGLFGGATETYPQHILSEREARVYVPGLPDSAYTCSDALAQTCKVSLPQAVNMTVNGDLEKLCRGNIRARLGRWTKRYEERLVMELKMIQEKNFVSYFLIISDMVRWAKQHMIVGPARGSAAGSLVCFLAYITDVDPIQHGLLFERFIDVTREDLPDIDLDFPDTKRDMVVNYLQQKYGADNVVHVGTVLTLQPKSILRLVSKRLNIKMWEFQPVLDVMVTRLSGDSRGDLCLLDTLDGMEAGRALTAKFPQVKLATSLEGHANTAGTHAAGIVVCAEPVKSYCTVDAGSSTAQIDKIDAEKINLLKIDVLGLRTLSVLEYTLEQLPPTKRPVLTKIPLDDKKAFDILNKQRWAGIFQFEGDALQMLQKTIVVEKFTDIVAIGALGRPGPLNSGGGMEWCNRRMGRHPVQSLHPLCDQFTKETYGIIVYQEQVMQIARHVGLLSWEDVTDIRKTMSKSKGEEYFNQYWVKFLAGAQKQGIDKEVAKRIWGYLTTMGAWAFNASHAVSYGLISYWTAYLKAHFPLEFAAATLHHSKNEDQTIEVLRELTDAGVPYVAFDPDTSMENWQVIDGKLTGGFLNIKGIGPSTAKELVSTRGQWTEKQKEKIANAEVLFSDIYPTRKRFGWLYDNPRTLLPAVNHIYTLREYELLKQEQRLPHEFFFLGRLADKIPRDLNEYVFQVKRLQEGKPKLLTNNTAYLNFVLEDDTAKVGMTIGAKMYEEVGKGIVETGVVGRSWYVMRGHLNQLGRINVNWAREITNEQRSGVVELAA